MKETLKYILWVFVGTMWTTLCFIAPDFADNPTEGFWGLMLVLFFILACSIGSFFLLYLMGSNKYICAVILPIWAIVGAGISFYRIGFRVTLTPALLDVTLHTNYEEAMGVISWTLIGWVVLNICFAIALILWRWKKITPPFAWAHAIIAIVLGTIYYNCNGRLQNSLCQRFPYSVPTTIRTYLSIQQSIHQEREAPKYTITEHPDSLTVVFVIGEAVRADHLQLNGYERETNPRLLQRKNIVSYPHIYSEQTHTLACMPYILTRADSTHEQPQYQEHSFITLFRHEGFYTAWLANQNLGSTFSHFPSESDTVIYANAGKTEFVYTPWMDEELLPIMDALRSFTFPRSLFILHTIGSHWYYNNHVPQEMYYFQPITTNRVIKANSLEQIINSYDNTIRYTDYFLDKTIQTLEKDNAILFYQSDHGEALGEEGAFLHAHEAKAVKNPACVIWYSDKFAAKYPDKVKALVANKDKRYRTDYVFYSILYAAGIRAEGDSPAMNIFSLE